MAEIRDYFCCPYMWWYRAEPLKLEDRERLQKLKLEPSMSRPRTMPFEVKYVGLFWLFAVACVVAAGITWMLDRWLNDIPLILYALDLIGLVTISFAVYFIVRWLQWRQRTPGYDRQLPGEVLFWEENQPELGTVHATEYGITGRLNIVLQQAKNLATLEYRSVVTPKHLTDQEQMQALAQALLAEAEFGRRPTRAYVLYPDKTFEVEVGGNELRRLLEAVHIMHRAKNQNLMPEVKPAWDLCPSCPIAACARRIARPSPLAKPRGLSG